MKRLGFLFGVGLLTFSIGVGIVAVYLKVFSLSAAFTASSLETSQASRAAPLSGKVVIKFQRFLHGQYTKHAVFRIINGSSEPLYYYGYGTDDHCSYKVKRGDNVREVSHCWCGTGLKERELLPGQMATYQARVAESPYGIYVVEEPGKLQVGFNFSVGRARHKQTVWSDEVIIPEPWEIISR